MKFEKSTGLWVRRQEWHSISALEQAMWTWDCPITSLSFHFLIHTWTWNSQVLPSFWGREGHFLISLSPLPSTLPLGSRSPIVTSAVLQDIVQVPGIMSSNFGQFSLVGPFAWSRFACHCQNWFYPITKHSSFTSLSNIQVGDPTVRTSLPMALGPSLLWPTILRLTNTFQTGIENQKKLKNKSKYI